MKIEISFDDTHISDLRAAKLMEQYGFRGTFYASNLPVTKYITPLSLKEIKDNLIDKGHQVGGHSMSHPMDMKLLTDEQLQTEMVQSMNLISRILKHDCKKFCYPRGRHDARVRHAANQAGFKEARTTKVLQIRNKTLDPMQTPTTIHMFARNEYGGRHWFNVAVDAYKQALEASRNDENVFFSIWGHSWELDVYRDWDKFEDILKFMRDNPPHHGA